MCDLHFIYLFYHSFICIRLHVQRCSCRLSRVSHSNWTGSSGRRCRFRCVIVVTQKCQSISGDTKQKERGGFWNAFARLYSVMMMIFFVKEELLLCTDNCLVLSLLLWLFIFLSLTPAAGNSFQHEMGTVSCICAPRCNVGHFAVLRRLSQPAW